MTCMKAISYGRRNAAVANVIDVCRISDGFFFNFSSCLSQSRQKINKLLAEHLISNIVHCRQNIIFHFILSSKEQQRRELKRVYHWSKAIFFGLCGLFFSIWSERLLKIESKRLAHAEHWTILRDVTMTINHFILLENSLLYVTCVIFSNSINFDWKFLFLIWIFVSGFTRTTRRMITC